MDDSAGQETDPAAAQQHQPTPSEQDPAEQDESSRDRTGPLILGVAILLVIAAVVAALVLRACGTEDVTVPDVSGLGVDEAGATLEENDLSVGVVTTETAGDIAPGVVITQTPMPGATVSAGRSVNLVVSTEPEWVKTPEVIGLSISDAEEIVREAGLEPLQYQGYSQDYATGFIAGQLPEYNVPALRGDPMLLYSSIGYRTGGVVVPTLRKTSVEAAVKSVEDAGLDPEVVYIHSDTASAGDLAGQVPAAGVRVPEGSKVAVVVIVGTEE
jgi:serine/threonine-protein kinase